MYFDGGLISCFSLSSKSIPEFDFESVFVYEEGIPVWESSGYPLNSNIDGNKITVDDSGNLDKTSILKWIVILLSGLFLSLIHI